MERWNLEKKTFSRLFYLVLVYPLSGSRKKKSVCVCVRVFFSGAPLLRQVINRENTLAFMLSIDHALCSWSKGFFFLRGNLYY